TVNGASLDTYLSLNPGTYNTVVQEWDNCGTSSSTTVTITVTSGSSSGVTVTSPANNSTVTSPVHYVATATTTCNKGVAAMGIYTADNVLVYTANGASLDTYITLNPGTYNTTVQEWDNCGKSASTKVTITVTGSGTGSTFYGLHKQSGWTGYALLPPTFAICSYCKSTGPEVIWSWTTGISSPSMSGSSTKSAIGGGDTDYADIL